MGIQYLQPDNTGRVEIIGAKPWKLSDEAKARLEEMEQHRLRALQYYLKNPIFLD